MLGFFIAALLATPWGLVVRIRELAWLNALITIAQVGFAALADLRLIQGFGLWGAVPPHRLTAALTIIATFTAWRAVDPAPLRFPLAYARHCLPPASPYLL